MPLNNVTTGAAARSGQQRLGPRRWAAWYAAWFRLGLCEVRVRVRRDAPSFVGEYGPRGQFRLHLVSEAEVLGLGREVMRSLASGYGADARSGSLKN